MKNRFSSIIYPLNALTTQLICRCCLIGISSWPPNLRLEQQNSPFCSGSWSWVAEPLDEGMQKLAYLQCLPRGKQSLLLHLLQRILILDHFLYSFRLISGTFRFFIMELGESIIFCSKKY